MHYPMAGHISIHAPPRGATGKENHRSIAGSISIHAPPRGATGAAPAALAALPIFQFTPLREGRPGSVAVIPYRLFISIHAPPRGATMTRIEQGRRTLFQFTPLREGRQVLPVRVCEFPLISIHAPPRGATNHLSGGQQHDFTFQFTPLREGRRARA